MTSSRKIALSFVATFSLCAPAILVRAKADATQVQTQAARPIKARFEVLHFMSNSIQVRSLANEREIHTFSYSDQIRDRMQKLMDQGGYQYGDKVKIWYVPGAEVALKIKGKPSKSL
jgi:hypothetical protein